MSELVTVIMAGGKGQRFWPLSTESRPKQFLDLEQCGFSLLQQTYKRLLPLSGKEKMFVATAEAYVELIKNQLPDLPPENILVEPVGRDSAPAIALASMVINKRFGDTLVGFFPSDHRVGLETVFRDTVAQAIELTEAQRGISTIGIKASFPSTAYGYIQAGEPKAHGFKVNRFVEKPALERAQTYLAEGNYYWNSGMFLWHTSTILAEFLKHQADLILPLQEAFFTNKVNDIFASLPKISIDYAIMEKTELAYVIPGDFDWDDLGDWLALERLLPLKDQNTVVGKHIGVKGQGNVIYLEDNNDTVVTLGVNDLVIVKRGNTVFVTQKSMVQDIKVLLQHDDLATLSFEEPAYPTASD